MTNCATQTGHGRCCVTPAVKANGLWLCVLAGQRPFISCDPDGTRTRGLRRDRAAR